MKVPEKLSSMISFAQNKETKNNVIWFFENECRKKSSYYTSFSTQFQLEAIFYSDQTTSKTDIKEVSDRVNMYLTELENSPVVQSWYKNYVKNVVEV